MEKRHLKEILEIREEFWEIPIDDFVEYLFMSFERLEQAIEIAKGEGG